MQQRDGSYWAPVYKEWDPLEPERTEQRYGAAAVGIALLFFVKALLFAFFFTPLWDVPDEVGHYAYVADLADGRGIPLPGAAFISSDVVANWRHKPGAPPERNWIAGHPPLYHLLGVPFLLTMRAMTDDPALLYKAPRILSALLGAGAILMLFKAVAVATGDPRFAWVCSATLSFLPMFTHMSSGTNHDVSLTLIAAVVLIYWAKLETSGEFSAGVKLSVWLAVATAVKLSAIAVALPLLLLSANALRGRVLPRLLRLGTMTFIVGLPTIVWQGWLGGAASRRWVPSSATVGHLGWGEYLVQYPVLEHTVRNFVGLIGWTGTGQGEVRWLQISGWPYLPYALFGLMLTAACVIWMVERLVARLRGWGVVVSILWFCSVGAVAAAISHGWTWRTGWLNILYAALFLLPLLSLTLWSGKPPEIERLVLGSQFVLLVFTAAYLLNSWNGYRFFGEMRATHGRYFFVAIPFLAPALGLPAREMVRAWMPRMERFLLAVPFFFGLVEAWFFVHVVAHFYER